MIQSAGKTDTWDSNEAEVSDGNCKEEDQPGDGVGMLHKGVSITKNVAEELVQTA